MIRNLKALGLTLVAVFAMSAMVASAAQAAPELTGFDTETPHGNRIYTHTIVEGTTDPGFVDIFTAGPIGEVECHGHFEGTLLNGKATELTVNAVYTHPETNGLTDCTTKIGEKKFTTHIDMNGCHYNFNTLMKIKEDEYEGKADVVCDTGGKTGPITINITKEPGVTKCTVKVPAQNGLGPIRYTNNTSNEPTDVTVHAEVGKGAAGTTGTGIKFTSEGGLLNCGTTNGEHTGGTYTSTTTLQGFDTEGHQIDLEVSGE